MIGDNPTLVELSQRGGLREITPAMRGSLKLAAHEGRRTMTWNLFISGVVLVAFAGVWLL